MHRGVKSTTFCGCLSVVYTRGASIMRLGRTAAHCSFRGPLAGRRGCRCPRQGVRSKAPPAERTWGGDERGGQGSDDPNQTQRRTNKVLCHCQCASSRCNGWHSNHLECNFTSNEISLGQAWGNGKGTIFLRPEEHRCSRIDFKVQKGDLQ